MRFTLFLLAMIALTACGAEQATDADVHTEDTATAEATEAADEPATREPEETAEREAPHLEAAFAEQTRAPKPASTEAWALETVAGGLENPWALAFLPDGSMLVTERPGRLRHLSPDGTISGPLDGVPEVDNRNQGGLLDVAVAPDFEASRTIFLSFSEPHDDGTNNTAVARARLNDERNGLEDLEVIFSQFPPVDSQGHYGSRIVFEDEDTLWVTMGDRQGHPVRQYAQDPSNLIGTVARIHADGSVPGDNPYTDHDEYAPEIWSWGHRNIQAADRHPETGDLWTVEHGPRGGDELNLTEAGENYGWPTISYGIEYRGGDVYEGRTEADGMEQPVYFWDPVIAPSGMAFYTGDAFEAWQGDLFVGGLRTERVSRLVMDDGRVAGEEWLAIGSRVRDVVEGPDGMIYLVTDESDGQVMRIVPDNG